MSEKHKTSQKENYNKAPVIPDNWGRIEDEVILILLIIEHWTVVEQKRAPDLTQ